MKYLLILLLAARSWGYGICDYPSTPAATSTYVPVCKSGIIGKVDLYNYATRTYVDSAVGGGVPPVISLQKATIDTVNVESSLKWDISPAYLNSILGVNNDAETVPVSIDSITSGKLNTADTTVFSRKYDTYGPSNLDTTKYQQKWNAIKTTDTSVFARTYNTFTSGNLDTSLYQRKYNAVKTSDTSVFSRTYNTLTSANTDTTKFQWKYNAVKTSDTSVFSRKYNTITTADTSVLARKYNTVLTSDTSVFARAYNNLNTANLDTTKYQWKYNAFTNSNLDTTLYQRKYNAVTQGGALGTPASGTATNLSGTASGLTAGTVTTNANLTGPITSSGNATSFGYSYAGTASNAMSSAAADTKLQEFALATGFLNTANKTTEVLASGTWTTGTVQTPTWNYKVKLCTISGCGSGTALTVCSWTSAASTASTTQTWILSCNIGTTTTGSSGKVLGHGIADLPVGASANVAFAGFQDVNTAETSTIDLTAALFIDVMANVSTQSGTKNSTAMHTGKVVP